MGKKESGYKIVKPNPNSTGYLTMTKSGPRRVNDTNIGGHGRYAITHGGDRVGTWTPSGGSKKSGANTGLGWYMERGFGTPRKPVPDTPLARRLGIANKGRQMRDARGRFGPMTSILAPGAIAGLNENQDWEQNYHNSRMGGQPVMENQMPMMEDEEEEQGSIFGDMFDRDYSDMDMGPGGARMSRPQMNRMFKRQLNADEEPTDEEIEMERMADKARRRHGKSRQGITQRKALRQYLQRRKSAEEEEEDYDY